MSSARVSGGVSLPDRGSSSKSGGGVISRMASSFSQSPVVYQGKRVASDAAFVTKKLLKSTGKAAWIAGTTFLVLIVPLIIEMDRDQQLSELELQHASLLGSSPSASGPQK